MQTEIQTKAELSQFLSAFSVIQQGGGAYYRALKNSSDPYLAVGAWCALLDGKLLPRAQWDEVLSYCKYGAVRRKAFDFFQQAHDHDRARRAASTDADGRTDLEQIVMLSDLDFDAPRGAEAAGGLYLASGDIGQLRAASERAEITGGWRAALIWALRAVAIAPLSSVPLRRLFVVLESSSQPDLMDEIVEILTRRNLHLQIAQVYRAGAAMMRDNAKLCLTLLKPLDDQRVLANPNLAPFGGAIQALRASAQERLGEYKQAYKSYEDLNQADAAKDINPEHYYMGIAARARLAIPQGLPGGEHAEVVQMLGFPRSGTTLLENALNAHPMVETFEEISALMVAIDRIEQVIVDKSIVEEPAETFTAARAKYYADVESRRRKPDAQVLIDKMPIRSADADLISKLFPEWRYIFSIRHPYDVALSCFKQRFTPNPAMENFRTIAGAARLYDFAMTEWFKLHTMDDPKVHYVRYEELVADFERVTTGVLEFLGVPWDDAVHNFASAASNRAAKTPSYQKVRQGLSIGVQTQWRNYGFVFQSEDAAPLRKWVEFFGYPLE